MTVRTCLCGKVTRDPETHDCKQTIKISAIALITLLTLLVTLDSASATDFATGGNVTNNGTHEIHTFNGPMNGSLVVTAGWAKANVLVVAGGGGGGVGSGSYGSGAGGGGGGVISYINFNVTGTIAANVGAGAAAVSGADSHGNNGRDSVFGNQTATGGGGGAEAHTNKNGGNGGSGGGSSSAGTAGTGVAGQGYAGGAGSSSAGAGGGGAGEAGKSTSSGSIAGAGGTGANYTTSGSLACYGGGGGGGGNGGAGGVELGVACGGGYGGNDTGTTACRTGTDLKGGGGGSPKYSSATGCGGGSGIIIVAIDISSETIPSVDPKPSTTVTLNEPADNYHTNNATIVYNFTVALTEFGTNNTNCTLRVNGSNITSQLVSANGSYVFTNSNATVAEAPYSWTVNCTSYTANNGSQATNRTLVIDRTNPLANANPNSDVKYSNSTAWNINTNDSAGCDINGEYGRDCLFFNWTFSDANLYGYSVNVTAPNGQQYGYTELTNLLTTTATYATEYGGLTDPAWFNGTTGTFTVNATVSDDHTARTIGQYTVTKDLAARKLEVTTDTGAYIRLVGTGASCNPDALDWAREDDRYTWSVHFPCVRAEYNLTFNMTSSAAIIDRTALHPFPSFVVGKHWIDFDAENTTRAAIVTPNGQGGFYVTVFTSSPTIKFRSIGGLNIISYVAQFTVDTRGQNPQDISGSGTTTNATTITYTRPTRPVSYNYSVNTSTISTSAGYYGLRTTFDADGRSINAITALLSKQGTPAGRFAGRIMDSTNVSICNSTNNITAADLGTTPNYVTFSFTGCTPGRGSYTFGLTGTAAGTVTDYLKWSYNASYNSNGVDGQPGGTITIWTPLDATARADMLVYYIYGVTVGTTLYNQSGAVLYNGTNDSVSVDVTGLASDTSYTFYALSWSYINNVFYNSTQTGGANLVTVGTAAVAGGFVLNIYDEDTNTLINNETFSVSVTSSNYSNNKTTSNGTISFNLPNVDYYEFQYYTPNGSYQYSRSYFVTVTNTSNTQLRFYAVKDDVSQYLVPQVVDKYGLYVENATIYMLRGQIESNQLTAYNVEMSKTDTEGKGLLRLVPNNVYYKFIVTTPNSGTLTTAYFKVTTSTKVFQVGSTNDLLSGQTKVYGATAALSFSNTTNTFSYAWVDNTSSVTQGCLKITKTSKIGIKSTVMNTCNPTSTGALAYIVTDTNGTSYVGDAQINVGDNVRTTSLDKNYDGGPAVFGLTGVFLATVTLLSAVTMAGASVTIAIIVGCATILLMAIVGLIAGSWVSVVGIIVVGGIIIFKANKA